jgi:hypothetical protein
VAQSMEARSQKIAFSIPEGVPEMFHCLNPSGRTMALGVVGSHLRRCINYSILMPSLIIINPFGHVPR